MRNETATQRGRRLAKKRQKLKEKTAELSSKELVERRNKKRLYMHNYRASQSEGERAARLKLLRQYSAKYRASKSEKDRAACSKSKELQMLPNDMENYMKFKIMGGLKQIRMKKDCVPTRFDCQPKRKVGMSPLVQEVGVDETKVASTSGVMKDPLETIAVIPEVPEVELDQPEYWYPEESDPIPGVCSDIKNKSNIKLERSNSLDSPNVGSCEEYTRSNALTEKNKDKEEITDVKDLRYFHPENNDLDNQIINPTIVKQEIEEIVIKEECEDVEDVQHETKQEQNFEVCLDSVKTEAIEISEVFFTPYGDIGSTQEEEIKDFVTAQSVSSGAIDDEATDTASEAEYYYNEYNRFERKIRKRRISDEIDDDDDPLKFTLRIPTNRQGFKLHKCHSCNFSTRNETNLNIHIRNVHQKLTTKSFKCKYCNYNTDIEKFLEKHVMTLHTRADKYKCDYCSYSTSTKASIQLHFHTLHPDIKPLECEHCDFRTNRAFTLKNHIRGVHLKLKRHKCKECDYESHHKPSLEQHIRRKHLNMGRFECKHCDYKTDFKKALKRHTETEHVDLKKYKCEECDYRANSQAVVEVHKNREHLKVEKLKCERCNFETFCYDVLDKHNKRLHKEINWLKCEFCYFKTPYKAAINRHVKAVHL